MLDLQRVLSDEELTKQLYYEAEGERLSRSFRLYTYEAFRVFSGGSPLMGNWHVDGLCEALQYWVEGEIKSLMINMPPRVLKSVLCGVLLPSWAWIHNPRWKWLFASYVLPLAVRDARYCRNLMQSDWFIHRFADKVMISKNTTNAADYYTTAGGRRLALSPESKTTGEGGHANVIDDLHNVKDVESKTTRQSTLNWHDDAFWNRYEDPKNHRRLYVGQRTHMADVYGHVKALHGDDLVYIEIPMEYRTNKPSTVYIPGTDKVLFHDPRQDEGELLHPDRLGHKEIEADRRSLSEMQYQAQYQQAPQGDGGLIIKRKYWHAWEWPEGHRDHGKPRPLPLCEEIFQVYDTAFEEGEENDYSARTTWGLFRNTDPGMNGQFCLLMLDRFNERVSFPDLVDEAVRSYKDMEPDRILIEKKASGHSLLQVLRKKRKPRIPVRGVRQMRGKQMSKTQKAHKASIAFENDLIYYVPRTWAYEVIEQTCAFPQDEHDDMADTVFIAATYCLNRNKINIDGHDVDVFSPETKTIEVVPGYGLNP